MGPRTQNDRKLRKDQIKLEKMNEKSGESNGMSCPGTANASNSYARTIVNLMDCLVRLQDRQRSQHMSSFCMDEQFSQGLDMFDDIRQRIHNAPFRRARKVDVNSMLRMGILNATEWANQFVPFRTMSHQNKKALLKEYSFSFVLIDQGYLTAQRPDDDLWILQNNTFMSPDYYRGLPEEDVHLKEVPTKAKLHPLFVQDALTSVGYPMKLNQIDLFECAVIKTIILLGFKNYFGDNRSMLDTLQSKVIQEAMDYCIGKVGPDNAPERLGIILLQITSIRCAIKSLSNQTLVSDLFNLMIFDSLVRDVLLLT
ncbi:hypothetical protein WR25_16426 [Diploscapter pachys]|uniref:NR LBD domain-containing protein n=1 Tax=Diploscapter pachys TaxID=2018661 RepID=A0A2A2JVY4_9BILA|nr:hypothetical protein WR25_16426 [Diploscapter pachys]